MPFKRKTFKAKGKSHSNAKKVIYNGIEFDSGLEADFYKQALLRGLPVEVKPETVVLLQSFEFGKTLRGSKHVVDGISYTYDFRIGSHYIETKGMLTKDASIRIRLFKHYLLTHRPGSCFYMPRKATDIGLVLDLIQGIPRKKLKKAK